MNQETRAYLGMMQLARVLLAVVIIGPCGATDDAGSDDGPFGRCTLPAGHQTGGWHQEWRDGRLWAEWRGPAPGERCDICGKDGAEH